MPGRRVQGAGFKGAGFKGAGCRVQGLRLRVYDLRLRIYIWGAHGVDLEDCGIVRQGAGGMQSLQCSRSSYYCRVYGSRFKGWGLGFKGSRFRIYVGSKVMV